MTINHTTFLPENQLIGRIELLEKSIQQLRTAQSAASDVQAPFTASVVTATDHTMAVGTWQDVPGLTTDITVSEDSTIVVLLQASLSGNPFLGDSDLSMTIAIDGTRQTDEARAFLVGTPPIDDINVAQGYIFTATTGAHTIKAQVQSNIGLGVILASSAFAYWVFRQ